MSSTPTLYSSYGFCIARLMDCRAEGTRGCRAEGTRWAQGSGVGCLLDQGWPSPLTHLHQEVKDAGVEPLGQGVAGVGRLLHVEGDGDGLGAAAPLAVHFPAGDLLVEALLVDPQQVGREGQGWAERGWSGLCPPHPAPAAVETLSPTQV